MSLLVSELLQRRQVLHSIHFILLPGQRREDNIKLDHQEVGWREGGHELNSSGSIQEQVVGSCECRNEPLGYTKCRVFLE